MAKRNPNLRKISRAELREERYRHMGELGFSVEEKRRFRDHSAASIEAYVQVNNEAITAKRKPQRTEREQKIFSSIRTVRRRNQLAKNEVDTAPRLKPQSERLQDFKDWTSARDFPNWANTYISVQNRARGLDPLDSYGYRRFYYRYVDGDNEDFIDQEGLADRDNSGEGNPE